MRFNINSSNLSSRLIELAGGPEQCGFAHGETLREEIRQSIEIYRPYFGESGEILRNRIENYASVIRTRSPRLAREIEAIAEAANVSAAQVFALNARSELICFSQNPGECTMIAEPRSGLLAQTWDWLSAMEKLWRILAVEPDGGPAYLTITEPGVPAKIGMSSAGFSMGLNFMAGHASLDRLPVHGLLYDALTASDYALAVSRLRSTMPGTSANIVVMSKEGGAGFEYSSGDAVETRIAEEPYAHTNHPTSDPSGEKSRFAPENSFKRYDMVRSKLAGSAHDALDETVLAAWLSYASEESDSICRQPCEVNGSSVETLCTVIMDAKNQRLSIRDGYLPSGRFQKLDPFPLR